VNTEINGYAACARGARKTAHKNRQICKEVSRTLSCSLGASRDALIRDLAVVSVEPAPDAARLLVTVCSMSETSIDIADLLLRLRETRGRLRAEIAAVLQRRRTPDLIFRIAGRIANGSPCNAHDVQ